MTPQEIVEVVGMLGLAFGRNVTPETFEVYEYALADLDVPDARGVVKRLLRTMDRWPPPAVLRRSILESFGMLAPDEDVAWSLVIDFASSGGTDTDLLPHPAREALKAVGGTWAVKSGDRGVVHAQFRDAYRKAKERADRATLETSWNGLALTPGGDRHERDERTLPAARG